MRYSKQVYESTTNRISPQSQLWTRDERITYLHACLETNFDWKLIHAAVKTKSYKQCRDRLRKLICQEIDSRMRDCPNKNKDSEEHDALQKLIVKYVNEEKDNLLRLIVKCTETNRNQSCFKGSSNALRRKNKIKVSNAIAKSFGLKPIYTEECFESYLESKSAVTSSTMPVSKRVKMTSAGGKRYRKKELAEVVSDSDSISLVDSRTPARKKMRSGHVTPSPINVVKSNNTDEEFSDSEEDEKMPIKVIDLVSQLQPQTDTQKLVLARQTKNDTNGPVPFRGYGFPFTLVAKEINHGVNSYDSKSEKPLTQSISSSGFTPVTEERIDLTGTVQYAVESLLELKRTTIKKNPHFFQF